MIYELRFTYQCTYICFSSMVLIFSNSLLIQTVLWFEIVVKLFTVIFICEKSFEPAWNMCQLLTEVKLVVFAVFCWWKCACHQFSISQEHSDSFASPISISLVRTTVFSQKNLPFTIQWADWLNWFAPRTNFTSVTMLGTNSIKWTVQLFSNWNFQFQNSVKFDSKVLTLFLEFWNYALFESKPWRFSFKAGIDTIIGLNFY